MYTVLAGLGFGITYSTTFVIATARLDSSNIAVASAGFYQIVNVGLVCGLGAVTAVLQAWLRPELNRNLQGIPDKQSVSVLATWR